MLHYLRRKNGKHPRSTFILAHVRPSMSTTTNSQHWLFLSDERASTLQCKALSAQLHVSYETNPTTALIMDRSASRTNPPDQIRKFLLSFLLRRRSHPDALKPPKKTWCILEDRQAVCARGTQPVERKIVRKKHSRRDSQVSSGICRYSHHLSWLGLLQTETPNDNHRSSPFEPRTDVSS